MPKSKQTNKDEPKSLVLTNYPGVPDGTDLFNMPLEQYAYYQANRPDIIEELEAKKAEYEAAQQQEQPADAQDAEPETENAQEEQQPAGEPDPNIQPEQGGEN